MSQHADSPAYHEAGHMTAAVVQAMAIQPRGMHIDLNRCGISHYWMRNPGDTANTPKDQIERKRTIVTLYAAWLAERRFYPSCPDDGWRRDMTIINALLTEQHPTEISARTITAEDLKDRTGNLVDRFYPVMEVLAKALLDKPVRFLPWEELNTPPIWTAEDKGRSMPGSEVTNLYNAIVPEAKAEVRDPSEGTYDSSQKLPLFDILAP
jgi:hypothetical protein